MEPSGGWFRRCARQPSGVELLLQLVQHLVARQHLGQAAVGLAAFSDGGKELTVLQLNAANGAIYTLSLSFNNDGPLGTFFRYIGDTGTYIARYDDLFNGKDEKIDVSKVDVSMNGIELQDREFFAAIREGREPNSSVAKVFNCYQVLHQLEQQLNA